MSDHMPEDTSEIPRQVETESAEEHQNLPDPEPSHEDPGVTFTFEGTQITMPYEPERVDEKGQGHPTGVYGLNTKKLPQTFQIMSDHTYVHVAIAIQDAFD